MRAQEQISAQVRENNWLQVTQKDYAEVLSGNLFDDLDKLVNVL
jgi:hypothetical protein